MLGCSAKDEGVTEKEGKIEPISWKSNTASTPLIHTEDKEDTPQQNNCLVCSEPMLRLFRLRANLLRGRWDMNLDRI